MSVCTPLLIAPMNPPAHLAAESFEFRDEMEIVSDEMYVENIFGILL